tara:strand:+ start:49 stop:312 length:264 start_codon:yes stop_codon:yes gene_type:complete
MRILLIVFMTNFLLTTSNAIDEKYKLPNIQPKDLVNEGYKLHNVIPIESEGPRIMLYTFTKNTKIVSCVVELDAMFADGHICYNVTN